MYWHAGFLFELVVLYHQRGTSGKIAPAILNRASSKRAVAERSQEDDIRQREINDRMKKKTNSRIKSTKEPCTAEIVLEDRCSIEAGLL